MQMNTVTEMYLDGIESELANINSTIKGFSANSPVEQMLRGERDFWKNQLKKRKL